MISISLVLNKVIRLVVVTRAKHHQEKELNVLRMKLIVKFKSVMVNNSINMKLIAKKAAKKRLIFLWKWDKQIIMANFIVVTNLKKNNKNRGRLPMIWSAIVQVFHSFQSTEVEEKKLAKYQEKKKMFDDIWLIINELKNINILGFWDCLRYDLSRHCLLASWIEAYQSS